MAAASTDNFIKVGESTATTLSSPGYTIGATSINVASTTNWPTDTGVLFAIDEVDAAGARVSGTYNVFAGVVSGATQISSLSYVGGDANRNYSAGATTRVYVHVGADRIDRLVDGILTEHNQDGTHGNITATSITTSSLTLSGQSNDGWLAPGGTHSVSTGYNAGNRSFTINTSTDLSSIVSNGMRYRVTRGTTPPTQCADLEASSSHYASKSSPTGITFTDDFTCEAWIKLESYGATNEIITRFSTTGWIFRINTSGQVYIGGIDGSGTDYWTSYQSVPLNKWVHVAAVLDISGGTTSTNKVYIDGVSVPIVQGSNAATGITQAGNLVLGAYGSGTNPFDGKLADVRVWSDQRTATEIQDNMYAYPSDTTGLVAHFKLNGDFNDSSSNGNNLTAQNSAVATNADNPWNATEYGIITNVTSSTIQVFCPEGYGIPNETLTAPYYSTQSAPFGFPRDKGKWEIEYINKTNIAKSSPIAATWYNGSTGDPFKIAIPAGKWTVDYSVFALAVSTGAPSIFVTLSTANNTELDEKHTARLYVSVVATIAGTLTRVFDISTTAITSYYLNIYTDSTATTLAYYGATSPTIIRATCAYI